MRTILCFIFIFSISTLSLIHNSAAQKEKGRMRDVDLENLGWLRISCPTSLGREQLGEVAQQVIKTAKALPGVDSVAAVDALPFSNSDQSGVINAKGAAARNIYVRYSLVTSDYFRVVKLPLLTGRRFIDQDKLGSVAVAILSAGVARSLFGDEEPIGKRLSLTAKSEPELHLEVVGIASDVDDSDGQPIAEVYVAYNQNPSVTFTLIVRCVCKPKQIVERLKGAIQDLDSRLVVSENRD